jgi:methyl-accepting chemotaxis protein
MGGFLAVIALLVVALGVALYSLFGTSGALADLKGSNERLRQVDLMDNTQTQLVNEVMDYLWSENLTRLTEYDLTKSNLDKTLKAFQPTPAQKETYTTLLTEVKGLYSGLDQMLALNKANTTDSTDKQIRQLWQTQSSKQAVRVRALLQQLGRQELQQATQVYDQSQASASQTAWVVSILAAITFLLAIGLALVFTSIVTVPLSQLSQRLLNLAGGDLTKRLEIINRDELGEVAQTYNRTLLGLRELVEQLHQQGQLLSSASQELVLQASSQVAGSSQQAGVVSEANQTIRELNETASQIAQKATLVAEAVNTSLTQAEVVSNLADKMVATQQQGRTSVAKSIEQVNILKEQIGGIEEEQKSLLKHSGAIEKVLAVIEAFASETHLLSLNASIEAAGAGEYGSRFAVVAAEIKRLADNSAQSTKEVRAALQAISLGVARVSEKTQEGLKRAQKAVKEADQSDSKLAALTEQSEQVKIATRQIVEEVARSAELAQNIQTATYQQQIANNQMLAKMLEIEAVTAQTLTNVKQGEVISYQLRDSATKLKNSANAFILEAA